jgi:hypothetical protein
MFKIVDSRWPVWQHLSYTPLAVVSRARKTLRVSTTERKFGCFVERGLCDRRCSQHAKFQSASFSTRSRQISTQDSFVFFRWIIFSVTSLPHDSFATRSRQLPWTCRERVVSLSGTRWITRIMQRRRSEFPSWAEFNSSDVYRASNHERLKTLSRRMEAW